MGNSLIKGSIYIRSLIAYLILISLLSCEREEGFGGSGSIYGKIIEEAYNMDQSLLLWESEAADHNVYIIFGDQANVGDEVETSYEGIFSFNYLTPGDYEVYYYSEDTARASSHEQTAFSVTTSLLNNQDLDLGTLYTYRFMEFDEGGATIMGRVMTINYHITAIPPLTESDIKDIVPAQDLEVYLKYGDKAGYDERIRTDYNGYYRFADLIKGGYRIYVYSQQVVGGRYAGVGEGVIRYPESQGSSDLVLYRDAEVTEFNEVITLEDFVTEKQ
jgi:hypothetical protein